MWHRTGLNLRELSFLKVQVILVYRFGCVLIQNCVRGDVGYVKNFEKID